MVDSLVRYFRAMARNNAWSNHRLLGACARLSPKELTASRVSFFPSLSLTLKHILFVDEYYLDALEQRPRPYSEDTPWTTLAALQTAQSKCDRRLVALCDGLDARKLTRPVTLIRDEGAVEERAERVIAHLFAHQIHHRGQVHAMLAGTRAAPPQLDEFLLAMDAPLRSSELAVLDFREDEIWPAD